MRNRIARFYLGATAENPFQQRFVLALCIFQLGQQNAGDVTHFGRMTEVVLHENFDPAAPSLVLIPHTFGHLHLHVKGQLFRGAVGGQMQMGAGCPEEVFCLRKKVELFRFEHAKRHQFGHIADLINVLGNPEQRLEIAQAAFALFHIWLHHVALALFQVARIAFSQFGVDKFLRILREQIGLQPLCQLLGERFVTHQKTVFQHGGADGVVLATKAHAVFDCSAGMADLQAQVPQDI